MKENKLIIFGKQTCLYVLDSHSDIIEEIYFCKEINKILFNKFAKLNKPIIKLDSKKMQALAKGGNHQGFILKVNLIKSSFNFLKDSSKIIVLVGISDIGNIGSIFRSAYAFGVDLIISTNSFNESGVARTSSGAFFDMPYIIYKNSLSLINELKLGGFSIFGSDMKGKDILDLPNLGNKKWALFLGNEGEGLSNRLLAKMDLVLSISMKNFNSLNVSVAAGILMYRMVRK
ncbi:23S rRNA (guanosine(2251)-2'-O)-methyltransferase RlmB [Helicobacter sp. MIT 14-3879]|uniref:23S rRNA (guanosine(2251)-2'-O)-methyltransferase RlmB n=1 Tax=Helicobacter sp. MIT 14-3879 TaxID=2040649 RepID=UPI000E1E6D7D|nr:23S rRNA (guanosine(2251)-2'-O)-methyltransferase RlmB [Helicobacter sp. MIT 14-3879]RDU63137.1 23S rRNA (guanosine(2251)-2'-O)-methyltransferase RlmB [Helicobacter sp. MIT 14-3879]